MDKHLNQRLEILKEAGEITEEIIMAVKGFSEKLEKKYMFQITEENGAMLITHLSMALARIKKGERINEIDESVLEEVKETTIYNELPEFFHEIEKRLHIKIPDSEKGFIAVHVCTLVTSIKGNK